MAGFFVPFSVILAAMTKTPDIKPLKTRPQYLAVAKGGSKTVRPSMVVQFLPPTEGEKGVFVGLTVSAKAGNSVKRSRIKRRLREVIREIIPGHGPAGATYVIIGRARAFEAGFETLKNDLQSALTALHSRKPKKDLK